MSAPDPIRAGAVEIATAVRAGRLSARVVVESLLGRIERLDPALRAYTDVTADRARSEARAIDAAVAQGRDPGPLAGVPFAVKNLFDVAGVTTRAGSRINRDNAPATDDAVLMRRLSQAGAVLLGALNMGEYAYDFTGENAHDGASRNPHDPKHMSGGSSGGSGTAVAGGLATLSLGSDTNGSIRVPSSFCGLFGLKPTYGRLPRSGTFPFVSSLDHLGPIGRSVEDVALAYDVMQGADAGDPACTPRGIELVSGALYQGVAGLRIAAAGGYFREGALPEALAAVDIVARALGAAGEVEIPEARQARAAAYVITTSEGGTLHLPRLRSRAAEFDPDVRDRLLAGAMVPAAWVERAQVFRRRYRNAVLRLFESVDLILAPATPCRAPLVGQKTMTLGGAEMPVRPNLGLFTQPVSFIGLPVVAVPVWTTGERLPIGVQIIAPPWREDLALRAAFALEQSGTCRAPVAGDPAL